MLGAYTGEPRKMIDECYKQAIKILKECTSDIGFKASALPGGYREVWGRDSMITLLGAISSGDPTLKDAALASINTLKQHQTSLGLIPNNVDVENSEPQYRAYMDGTLWYIIGSYLYYQATQDKIFLGNTAKSLSRALNWLAHQDVDNSGLVSTQEASNWMDLFPIRGKVLYDNALYFGALRAGERMARDLGDEEAAKLFSERAEMVRISIQYIFWIHESQSKFREKLHELTALEGKIKNSRYLEDELIRVMRTCSGLGWRPYLLAFYGFREYGDWFDSLGNMLAILFDAATKEQSDMILDFAGQVGISEPYPIKAVYPPIFPGEKEWRDYFKIGNLNLPHHYHNGGIWPFVGGFYVAALTKAGYIHKAQKALEALAKANHIGKKYEWEFNEWLHGVTGNPMGYEKQAWSAGMYIFAYNCVKNRRVNLL